MSKEEFEQLVVKHFKPIFLNYLKEYRNLVYKQNGGRVGFNYVLVGASALELQVQDVKHVDTKDADVHVWFSDFKPEFKPHPYCPGLIEDDKTAKKPERINEVNKLANQLIEYFQSYEKYNSELIKYFKTVTKAQYITLKRREKATNIVYLFQIFGVDIADIVHTYHKPEEYLMIPDKFPILTVKSFLIDHLKIFFQTDKLPSMDGKNTALIKMFDKKGKQYMFNGIYSENFKPFWNENGLNNLFLFLNDAFYEECKLNREFSLTEYYKIKGNCCRKILDHLLNKNYLNLLKQNNQTDVYRVGRIEKTLNRLAIVFMNFYVVKENNGLPLSITNLKINFREKLSSCLILSIYQKGGIFVDVRDKQFCNSNVVIGNSGEPSPPNNLNVTDKGTSNFLSATKTVNFCLPYGAEIKNLPVKYSDAHYICHWTMSSRMTSNQCMNFYYSALFGNLYNITPYADTNRKSIYELINNIQRIIYTSELNETITVYRASRSTIYKKDLSTYNLKVGGTYFQPVFCSTTIFKGARFLTDFSNFETGLAAFVIKIPRGSRVLYLKNCSTYQDEYEVLLPLGCGFKITGVDDNKYVKGGDDVYFKMRIYYADYVQPDKNTFDVSKNEMNWSFIRDYVRDGFVRSKEIVLPEPTILHPKPSDLSMYCKDIGEYFAKVIAICKTKIDEAVKLIKEKVFTFENLKQIVQWFETIFKNLLEMFDYIAPIVWDYFITLVIDFKNVILLSSITFLNLGKIVINAVFSGLEYILTLGLSGYSKEVYLQYIQNKKLKV